MPQEFKSNTSLDKFHPVWQGIVLLALSAIAMVFGNFVEEKEHFEWYIAASAILLFTTANPIIGIFKKKWGIYILFSFVIFSLLVALEIFMANFMAAENIGDLVQFRLIFIAEVLFFVLVNFLVAIFRGVVNMIKAID